MKITKTRLNQIIAEELKNILEVDNNQAQIATAQDVAAKHLAATGGSAEHQSNYANNSDDEQLLVAINKLSHDMNNLIVGLTGSKRKDMLIEAVAKISELAGCEYNGE